MQVFSPVNVYGSAVLIVMMVFYIYENRKPVFTLLFGVMCIGSSAYGFLAGTWPFGVIEIIWAAFSIRKYISIRGKGSPGHS
ncbi:MAG: hypothetical protein M1431_06710 [Candidatus Thermoplasmatota archaeon]|nr:hypothetical protein [Candidatus Thermoplasmatota archaeon]